MNGLLIVATAAFLLLMPQFNDADAAGPYDSEWTGTATSIDERCKRAVFTLIVEGQVVLGHARFEGDAPNVNGTVDENGALGATIGFQPFRGRSEPPDLVGVQEAAKARCALTKRCTHRRRWSADPLVDDGEDNLASGNRRCPEAEGFCARLATSVALLRG